MNRPPTLLAVFWLTACSGVTTLPVPADSRIIVPVAKGDSALTRAESAFVAEGLPIDSRSGSTVTTVAIGYWHSPRDPFSAPVVYAARLITTGSGESLVLSGTAEEWNGNRRPPGFPDRVRRPLDASRRGDLGEAWKVLERVAERLRG